MDGSNQIPNGSEHNLADSTRPPRTIGGAPFTSSETRQSAATELIADHRDVRELGARAASLTSQPTGPADAAPRSVTRFTPGFPFRREGPSCLTHESPERTNMNTQTPDIPEPPTPPPPRPEGPSTPKQRPNPKPKPEPRMPPPAERPWPGRKRP